MTVKGDKTRQRIVEIGIEFARDGLHRVSARAIAAQLGISHTAVTYYFPTIRELRDTVAVAAVRQQEPGVIARLIMDKHAAVDGLSRADRARYLAAL